MARFWPPHQGYGIGEFSLAFTICLILFIRLIDIPTVIYSLSGATYSNRLLNFLLTPIYTSICPFILLLPMMRLSEMHVFVLALNFAHLLISSYIVYSIWFFWKCCATEKAELKDKTE
uniref:MATE efflux family protein n=1 Tax=Caenorhabditis tropicalis TaxID=1561998 RepID=A0A1I7TWR5_9PELO